MVSCAPKTQRSSADGLILFSRVTSPFRTKMKEMGAKGCLFYYLNTRSTPHSSHQTGYVSLSTRSLSPTRAPRMSNDQPRRSYKVRVSGLEVAATIYNRRREVEGNEFSYSHSFVHRIKISLFRPIRNLASSPPLLQNRPMRLNCLVELSSASSRPSAACSQVRGLCLSLGPGLQSSTRTRINARHQTERTTPVSCDRVARSLSSTVSNVMRATSGMHHLNWLLAVSVGNKRIFVQSGVSMCNKKPRR